MLNSQKTPQTSPVRWGHEVSFVSTLWKNHRVITMFGLAVLIGPQCDFNSMIYGTMGVDRIGCRSLEC